MRNKILSITLILFSIFVSAQDLPIPGGGTGTGGNGNGRPASPIDMYVYILAIAAILMIVYFAKKYKTQKI
jgi:hypothetical protein